MKKLKLVLAILIVLAILDGAVCFTLNKVVETQESCKHDEDIDRDDADGVHIIYKVTGKNGEKPTQQELNDTISILSQRIISKCGTEDFSVYSIGFDLIIIDIPDVTEDSLNILKSPVEIYFIREYNDNGSQNYCDPYGMGYSAFYELAEGVTIESLQESGDIVISGEDIAEAQAGIDNSGYSAQCYIVELTLTDEGAKKFATATKEAYENGWTIGIYYDGAFISVPRVQAVITDGKVSITGMGSYESAENLAEKINSVTLGVTLTEHVKDNTDDENSSDYTQINNIAVIVGIVLAVLLIIDLIIIIVVGRKSRSTIENSDI